MNYNVVCTTWWLQARVCLSLSGWYLQGDRTHKRACPLSWMTQLSYTDRLQLVLWHKSLSHACHITLHTAFICGCTDFDNLVTFVYCRDFKTVDIAACSLCVSVLLFPVSVLFFPPPVSRSLLITLLTCTTACLPILNTVCQLMWPVDHTLS